MTDWHSWDMKGKKDAKMARLILQNRQKKHPVDRVALRRTLVRLVACLPLREKAMWKSVTVLLVDDRESGRIHGATFGDPAPTDVITLRYRDLDTEAIDGELIVNVECAHREGERRAGWGFERELALYFAHGLDHLCGNDDDTPASRRHMRQRELRWLKKCR